MKKHRICIGSLSLVQFLNVLRRERRVSPQYELNTLVKQRPVSHAIRSERDTRGRHDIRIRFTPSHISQPGSTYTLRHSIAQLSFDAKRPILTSSSPHDSEENTDNASKRVCILCSIGTTIAYICCIEKWCGVYRIAFSTLYIVWLDYIHQGITYGILCDRQKNKQCGWEEFN